MTGTMTVAEHYAQVFSETVSVDALTAAFKQGYVNGLERMYTSQRVYVEIGGAVAEAYHAGRTIGLAERRKGTATQLG